MTCPTHCQSSNTHLLAHKRTGTYIRTRIIPPDPTELARRLGARHARFDRYAIALGPFCDAFADGEDFAGCFVSEAVFRADDYRAVGVSKWEEEGGDRAYSSSRLIRVRRDKCRDEDEISGPTLERIATQRTNPTMFPKMHITSTNPARPYMNKHLSASRARDRLLDQVELMCGVREAGDVLFLVDRWNGR